MDSSVYLQICFYCIDEGGLGFVFCLERGHDPFIDGAFCNNVMNDDGVVLSLPPQSGVCLLIQFEGLGEAEPDERGTTVLQVESVPGRSRMDQANRKLASVPAGNTLRTVHSGGRNV